MLSLGVSLVDFDASGEHAGVCIWKCEIRLELRREVKSRKSFGRNLHKGDNCSLGNMMPVGKVWMVKKESKERALSNNFTMGMEGGRKESVTARDLGSKPQNQTLALRSRKGSGGSLTVSEERKTRLRKQEGTKCAGSCEPRQAHTGHRSLVRMPPLQCCLAGHAQ